MVEGVVCGCERRWLVGGRSWVVHRGALRLNRFLAELSYWQENAKY